MANSSKYNFKARTYARARFADVFGQNVLSFLHRQQSYRAEHDMFPMLPCFSPARIRKPSANLPKSNVPGANS
jgi:hypothetical protein